MNLAYEMRHDLYSNPIVNSYIELESINKWFVGCGGLSTGRLLLLNDINSDLDKLIEFIAIHKSIISGRPNWLFGRSFVCE